jgi:hypothetical protein
MKIRSILVLCLTAFAASACSFHARDANSYRKATREVLETRSADIKGCYDAELKKDPKVSGVIVVKLTVEKETGVIKDVRIDDKDTTAPTSLGQCVVGALDGLKLDPPDARDGDATFRWELAVQG